ncbi:MAG: nucleoside monophosphate kinase [Vicinamibacteria bacterium]|nr:nucleoside monophosphate kinase [Vicinamibacteria bacterium]
MKKYVIMGVQGSGKGTQARRLVKDLDLIHISVGDLFRWHIQNRTRLGAQVKRIVTSGALVPDETVERLVAERLEQHDWNHGFILDGFPRNAAQAEFFLERWDVDAVVVIEVPDAVVSERMLARRLCESCGRDYNLISSPPKVKDTCDCGGRLVQRADDQPGPIRDRLKDYRAVTEPVIALFRKKEKVVVVDGTQAPESVYRQIRSGLDLDG